MPTLTTDRLILRRIAVSDTDDMYEYACLDEVTKYLTWYPNPDKEYTHDYLEYLGTRYRVGDFFDWAVTLKESGKMIGTCGFSRFNYTDDSAEVGYVINPKYRGNGYAPEALAEVLRFGFENLGLNRLEARYMNGNSASRRVMEKVGMTFEGVHYGSMLIKGDYRDVGVCAILRNNYI